MERTPTIEWVKLDSGRWLLASASHAWLATDAGEFAGRAMPAKGSLATTRKLLDGAVGAAFTARGAAEVPVLTLTRWAWRLAGMYHLTSSTTPWMREAARRFADQGRDALAAWAEEKAREERGHDRLALRDLEDLGYDAPRLVRALMPETATRLVHFFMGTVRAADPVGCVGYAYALERLATTVREDDIRRVDAILPPGSRATRCLRMHSAVGGDPSHVEETIAVVAGLSAAERSAIALACYEAARICFEPPRHGFTSDAEIAAALHDLVRTPRAASNATG
jgi:hypothetical protein